MNLKTALADPEFRLRPRSGRQRQVLLASGAGWLVFLVLGVILMSL